MTDERYWANRCRLAEEIAELTGRMDTHTELLDAWKEYHEFIREHGSKEYGSMGSS